MKLLIVSAVFPPEPVVSSQLSFDIAENMAENGNAVTVICPRPTRPLGYIFADSARITGNISKVVLNSYTCAESKIFGRFRESLSFGIHCFRFIRDNHKDFDVIYANTWPLFAQYYLIKAANKYGIPIVLHIQDLYPESIAEKQRGLIKKLLLFLFIPLDKYILKKCSKVIAISFPMMEYIVKTRKVENSKVYVVRNWQNDSDFINSFQKKRVDRAEFVFMYLGTINPSASVDTMIHAFGRAKLPKAKLIIAGEGSDKSDCIKVAHQYPGKIIEFISAPLEKVHEIQQQADVLLLPLKKGIAKTATPSKLTAYMFSGKPIIACVEEESDTATCILEANCGFVVEPENPSSLAMSMETIYLTDKVILAGYGKNGLDYAINNLSKEKNLKRLQSLITDEN